MVKLSKSIFETDPLHTQTPTRQTRCYIHKYLVRHVLLAYIGEHVECVYIGEGEAKLQAHVAAFVESLKLK